MSRTILRTPAVIKRRGTSRSAHYADVKAGLFVKPVAIGLRARGTPEDEVDALIAATIAGKSDDEKRALVRHLEAARKTAK
jgi:prophage regulatory protein